MVNNTALFDKKLFWFATCNKMKQHSHVGNNWSKYCQRHRVWS